MTAIDGWVEYGECRDIIGDISDDHGAVFFFKRQNHAYSDLKEGEQVKFRVQQNAMNGKQAIHITREEPPAAPSVKKHVQPVVSFVASAKVKSNPTAKQLHKVVPAEKQTQNVKPVPSAQANSCGPLNFANAVSGKIELRAEDERSRGALTAIVPSGISAVEARMKTMEESFTAMVKRMHELHPLPDPKPPSSRT